MRTTGLSTGNQTWIYGSEGTIYVDRRQNVFAGRRGDSELAAVPNPRQEQAFYRVEEEFINAIRGIEEVTMAPFENGRPLHGVDGGRVPQLPDGTGGVPPAVGFPR